LLPEEKFELVRSLIAPWFIVSGLKRNIRQNDPFLKFETLNLGKNKIGSIAPKATMRFSIGKKGLLQTSELKLEVS